MVEPFPAESRSIVLIGLMGAGKTSVGRRLGKRYGVSFVDADDEIVKAAGMSIEDIFDRFGEAAFRDGERRVIARLLSGGPQVLATGGGAFMDESTRARIRNQALSVWLKAELDVLVARTNGRGGRPLLKNTDVRAKLASLMTARYPVYAEADLTVVTRDEPLEATVARVMDALRMLPARSPHEIGRPG